MKDDKEKIIQQLIEVHKQLDFIHVEEYKQENKHKIMNAIRYLNYPTELELAQFHDGNTFINFLFAIKNVIDIFVNKEYEKINKNGEPQ
jgi:hypothetical protein